MSLTGAKIAEEVWLTCVTHALSTETEEIMGLLFGDIEYSDGHVTALVWDAAPQTRSDRRKDRVETNPEQLAAASAQAEKISSETGRLTRVIGWYHSHPHITVLPSHVDVRTQGMYQLLDPGFLGLIFSCFNEDANKIGKIQATAFQAVNGWQRNNVQTLQQQFPKRNTQDLSSDTERETQKTPAVSPSSIQSSNSDVAIINVPDAKINNGSQPNVVASVDEHFGNIGGSETSKGRMDNISADILGLYENRGQQITGGTDMDSFDLTAGMQEAMHLSNLDMSGAEFTRKEVPFEVVPGHTLANMEFPLSSLVSLQRILFDEEQTAYNQSLTQNRRKGRVHPLTAIHHSATYQASICKLMEYCLSPVLSSLWDRSQENNIRLALLQEESMNLQLQLLSKGTRTPAHSQRHMPGSVIRESAYSSSPERRAGVDLYRSKDARRG